MNLHTDSEFAAAVANAHSVNGVLTALNLASSGSASKGVRSRAARLSLDTSHFQRGGQPVGTIRLVPEVLFSLGRPGDPRRSGKVLRRMLIAVGRDYLCEKCAMSGVWQGEKIVLHVDHVNGDHYDNQLPNLRFLCPNCHSQTPTFGNKNRVAAHYCVDCGKQVLGKGGTRCSPCAMAVVYATHEYPEKIDWPNDDQLTERIAMSSATAVARELGVASSAIHKRLKKRGCEHSSVAIKRQFLARAKASEYAPLE